MNYEGDACYSLNSNCSEFPRPNFPRYTKDQLLNPYSLFPTMLIQYNYEFPFNKVVKTYIYFCTFSSVKICKT